MAAFDSKLGKADTSFASAGPTRAPADTSGERDQMIAQAIGIGAKAAGSAYAKSQAGKMSGADMSLAEANQQADVVDAKIEEGLAAETDLGPVNPRRAAEIKDAALSEFATNDRTLVALRDRGTLSTIEARARRTLNLKRALSNPINSMFRQDFINAAKDLTGGQAMDDLLQETPEEKANRELREKKNEAIAKFEAEKTDYAVRMGISEESAGSELRAQQSDLDKIAKLNGLKAERELNQFEQEEFFATTRSSSGREVAAFIKEYSTANGGKGLMPNQMQGALRQIEGLYQKQLQALQTAKGVSGSYRDAEIARLKSWRDGQTELVKAYDINTLDKAEIEQLELAAQKIGWQNVGALMAYKAIDPRFFDVWMKSGGNLKGWIDQSFGGNAGTNFEKAAKSLASMNSWVMDGKAQDPAAVAAFLNTPEGAQYLADSVENEIDDPGAPKVSDKTAQIYADQTETSLKSFTSGVSIMSAQNNPRYRGEVLKALDIATGKFEWLNKSKGGEGAITIEQRGTIGRNRRPRMELNIPDGLTENAGEIKQLYRVLDKQPWTWEHVADEYLDAADAFNGLMRGEWQPEINTEKVATEKSGARGTRLKTEAPADTGTELKAPDTGIREADEAELRSLMEAELAEDGAPTEEQEARLVELLQQRIAIRDKTRTGGKPIDPRTERPEPAKAEAQAIDPYQPTIPKGKKPTLAIKNNNPGNIRGLGINYQGKEGEVDTPSGKFTKFKSPEYGMRALARDLDVKIGRGVNTIEKIINVYSPDADPENVKRGLHAEPYIKFVADKTGIPRDKKLTIADRAKLMKAISWFESGYDAWSDEVIQKGIELAGERGKKK